MNKNIGADKYRDTNVLRNIGICTGFKRMRTISYFVVSLTHACFNNTLRYAKINGYLLAVHHSLELALFRLYSAIILPVGFVV